MPFLLSKRILIIIILICLTPVAVQSRPLIARPEISILPAYNIVASYESFKRETEFINRQEDLKFRSAVLTLSRRGRTGFEYALSAGGIYAEIEKYTSASGKKIDSLKNSSPGYIISAEISRDIHGDLIVFTQWRLYLRGNAVFLSFDEADGKSLKESIDFRSDSVELALMGARQWYPATAYGALKFAYTEDRYKYTDSIRNRERTSRSRISTITPIVGVKYNISQNVSLRSEAFINTGFGESGFAGAVSFEF